MVEQIVQCLKLLNEERPQVILIPELENVKDSTVIREGFDLAFPGKRSPARTQPPVEELDLEAMEELLMWDEYRDW